VREQEAQARLAEAQGLLGEGELPAAERLLRELLAAQPDHPEALYTLAVVHRYGGALQAAIDTLHQVIAIVPYHARAHQELGHLYRAGGHDGRARDAYARALHGNPALQASAKGLLAIAETQGNASEAARLRAQLDWLARLPRPLIGTMELIAQNRLVKAEHLCRSYLQSRPKDVEAMRLLADIGLRMGVLDDAEFLLESAVEFAPDDVRVRMDYVAVLRKRQKFAAALAQAEALLARDPENPQFRSLCAIERMQTGDYASALTLLDQVLQQVPGDPTTLTTRGHALKTAGDTTAAIEAYRAAIDGHPGYGEAYYSLANLKTYRFDDQDLQAMQRQLGAAGADPGHRTYLHFAVAKALEDRGAYAQSFESYRQGNAIKRAQSRYDADQMRDEFRATAAVCTAELFDRMRGSGNPAPDPIFIVGLPRAGSTLLEQVLASHSQVDGTLELPNVLSLSQRLRRRSAGYPDGLAQLDLETLQGYGAQYLAETRIHRQGAPYFVDKMPNNFRHIGLIRLMLPNAKIIDARREPMACCFSGYKQLFAEGQDFSYDLTDVGRYYRDYVALMDHWDRVLPGFVLRMQHEDVVDDLETQVRRLLDFCGLPFEDACLRYYETQRSVRTPSSEQVRQPIFTDGLDQWRHFEPWLEPLVQALGDAAPALRR
jgi:tetratricopeptide (TPR) repeat protein